MITPNKVIEKTAQLKRETRLASARTKALKGFQPRRELLATLREIESFSGKKANIGSGKPLPKRELLLTEIARLSVASQPKPAKPAAAPLSALGQLLKASAKPPAKPPVQELTGIAAAIALHKGSSKQSAPAEAKKSAATGETANLTGLAAAIALHKKAK